MNHRYGDRKNPTNLIRGLSQCKQYNETSCGEKKTDFIQINNTGNIYH